MLILDFAGAVISRRCRIHYANRCTELVCLADELDFKSNPARPRPKATPGAPEISWGQKGIIHLPAPKKAPASSLPAPSGIMLRDPGMVASPHRIAPPPLSASRGRPTGLLPATVFIH
jgi:hypothetical protein